MLAQETTTPGAARQAIRSGDYRGHTAGLAPGYVQGNLVILPEILARDFIRFCQRNPKPCPLLAVSEPGDPSLPMLGRDIDVRTDLPRYRVWVHGVMVEEVTDLKQVWRDDFVSFVLGCSFSFEQELIRCGISLRHITEGKNVAMFQTNIPNVPAGGFGGSLVVTMRPMKPADAIRAIQITSRFPGVHGAPVHIGDPAAIGIADLAKPDFGDPVDILAGEIPVFWACGVTPQVAVREARPEICITHVPGSMIITDVLNTQLAVL